MKETKYGYLDKDDIFHVAGGEQARQYAKDGKMVAYDGTSKGGYPTVWDDETENKRLWPTPWKMVG